MNLIEFKTKIENDIIEKKKTKNNFNIYYMTMRFSDDDISGIRLYCKEKKYNSDIKKCKLGYYDIIISI